MAFVGDWRMQALPIYNAAILQWHATRDYLAENLKTILSLTASLDSEVDEIAKEWSKKVSVKGIKLEFSASQLFSPTQGQGQNRPKANALNVRERPEVFWILQFLRAVGLWHCMAPRTVRNGDDRKVYVLAPITLTIGKHIEIFQDFAAQLWNETSVKMDILASLLYTQTLLRHSSESQEDELDFEGYGPENVVAGLHVVTYKLLSRNAYTMMNLGFIGLPHWTGNLHKRSQVLELNEIIDEHLQVVRSIRTTDEQGHDLEKNETYTLLATYRDFLSGGQLETFFDFAVRYSQYLTHELEQKNSWVKPFTIQNLRSLFMNINPQLKDILENEGFRNIAYAIRHSTVILQYQKSRWQQNKGQKPLYDIQYGLGQQLARKAPYVSEFITELSDFLRRYSTENSQTMENLSKSYPGEIPEQTRYLLRKDIRTSDFDTFAKLLTSENSQMIGNLLIAYGYAREGKDDDVK